MFINILLHRNNFYFYFEKIESLYFNTFFSCSQNNPYFFINIGQPIKNNSWVAKTTILEKKLKGTDLRGDVTFFWNKKNPIRNKNVNKFLFSAFTICNQQPSSEQKETRKMARTLSFVSSIYLTLASSRRGMGAYAQRHKWFGLQGFSGRQWNKLCCCCCFVS